MNVKPTLYFLCTPIFEGDLCGWVCRGGDGVLDFNFIFFFFFNNREAFGLDNHHFIYIPYRPELDIRSA